MSTGILKVTGNKVVDSNGTEVLLRGAAIGGWTKYSFIPSTATGC